MTNLKHFEFFYRASYAEVLVDGQLAYKITYIKKKLVLTDGQEEIIAEIERDYTPLFLKKIIKVLYLNEGRVVTVDKNFWGTEYFINLSTTEKIEIKINQGIDYFVLDTKFSIEMFGGLFSKFKCKIRFDYEKNLTAEMIFITLFYELRLRDL